MDEVEARATLKCHDLALGVGEESIEQDEVEALRSDDAQGKTVRSGALTKGGHFASILGQFRHTLEVHYLRDRCPRARVGRGSSRDGSLAMQVRYRHSVGMKKQAERGARSSRSRRGGRAGAPTGTLQYTVRNIPERVDRAPRRRAAEERKSLNEVLRDALIREAGVVEPSTRLYTDLDALAGTWVDDPAFDETIRAQDQVDESVITNTRLRPAKSSTSSRIGKSRCQFSPSFLNVRFLAHAARQGSPGTRA